MIKRAGWVNRSRPLPRGLDGFGSGKQLRSIAVVLVAGIASRGGREGVIRERCQ